MMTIPEKLDVLNDHALKLKGKIRAHVATPEDIDAIVRTIWDIKTCIGDVPMFHKKKKKKHRNRG